ncbi:hypothetical protein [Pseudorhodoplanes sp.]|uniref:hypothetical protein n=1 Tax=Pseudorhodoplanes sp. TaxID=1934341 RepID=UPI003D0983F0
MFEHVIDEELFAELRQNFTNKEIVDLTLSVITINGWKRLAISVRREVGNYDTSRSTTRNAEMS